MTDVTPGDPAVVVLAGELDLADAPAMSARLQAAAEPTGRVIVDLHGVTFIDSTAIGALVGVRRALHERGGAMVLRRPSRAVARLLELTALDRLFLIEDPEDDDPDVVGEV
ncbi:MAG: STAS domain-containing protein [Frankiaceae bacterium]|jgi:anti-anti-sigma factor|nr:STAS domain-containing protein [Frankiaceae bacterium]